MTEKEVRQKLSEFVRNALTGNELILATVKSVDKTARTCTVDDDGLEYFGVRLQPVTENSKGLILFPAVDSFVLVTTIEGGDLAVIMCSNYESAEWKIDKLTFNGGDNGGLVKIKELENNLNSLKNYCTQLKSAVTSGLSAVGVGGSANGGTGATAFNSAMSAAAITFKNMADDKIKH